VKIKENKNFINEIECSKCSKNQKIITIKFFVTPEKYLCYSCKGAEALAKESVCIIHGGEN